MFPLVSQLLPGSYYNGHRLPGNSGVLAFNCSEFSSCLIMPNSRIGQTSRRFADNIYKYIFAVQAIILINDDPVHWQKDAISVYLWDVFLSLFTLPIISHVASMIETASHEINSMQLLSLLGKHWIQFLIFNSLRPRQNGRHFPDDIFKCIFLNESVWLSIMIPLKFVP